MKEVAELPEAVSDEEVKAKVAETFKNHDDLVKDLRGDQVL